MITFRINPIPQATAAHHKAIEAILIAHSDPRAGEGDWPDHDLCLAIAGDDGAMAGGLWGRFYYDWLFVELIFIPAPLRGQDLGSVLLAMAEAQTRAWGGVGVWLDTFTFQARGFYEKKGYSVFGEVADYPDTHKRFYLSKRLDKDGPTALTHPAILPVADPQPHHRQAIGEPLSQFNDLKIGNGPWPEGDIAFAIEDAAGTMIGGLYGRHYYNWLYIDVLVVPEALRGQGVGAELLRLAEAEAVRLGCVGVWLDTFSFQAPDFYPRHGYLPFGQIDAYPNAHYRRFFSKRLR